MKPYQWLSAARDRLEELETSNDPDKTYSAFKEALRQSGCDYDGIDDRFSAKEMEERVARLLRGAYFRQACKHYREIGETSSPGFMLLRMEGSLRLAQAGYPELAKEFKMDVPALIDAIFRAANGKLSKDIVSRLQGIAKEAKAKAASAGGLVAGGGSGSSTGQQGGRVGKRPGSVRKLLARQKRSLMYRIAAKGAKPLCEADERGPERGADVQTLGCKGTGCDLS